ncbi:peptidylprolyl isomerase [Propionivibrio dicarboxylicus]|uniref:Chaperone SurA n=1 Tax=Propionivibrio dicarboxylicus TaxID=83767 RepID=A0A1G8MB19_9RHOO|nr:peptidylprolyl isomerase [Propionivibrio dicarboxylicus]SDI65136.1 periplasmic chaperone for outer membrane proteins SurA [Propionivibrio dicarboxylicus]
MKRLFPWLCLCCLLSGTAWAQGAGRGVQAADRIVAVVNDEVVTYVELNDRLELALSQLRRQGTRLPPRDVLERQMLERLVTDKIQLQRAKEIGLRVDDGQLEQTLQRIAAGNKMSLAQFRDALQQDGIAFTKFREDIRAEMTIARLREREVDAKIVVSEGEIDNYLSGESAVGSSGEEYEIAHILLRAPEAASPEQIQRLRAKADQIYDRLKNGEDFAEMAASYSDAPDGLQGGSLGMRPLDRLPSVFSDVAEKLKVGEVAPLIRSSNGFHIVKLVAKRGLSAMAPVKQTRARHILIKVNELVSDTEARHKIEDLHERLKNGAKFEELARLFSQDASASKGGDLGWLYQGDTVPEFERAMDGLKPGELSSPVRSPFGYHLIRVEERRVQEASGDRKRASVRQLLKERRQDEAYQDWLRQERDRAYVESRLDEP